jgi:hypothetical protein
MSIDILKNLIREEVKRALKEAPESTPTLVVKNLAQANLWACEIVGQLSDGAWENTKPYSHWEVWAEADIKVGGIPGYAGFKPAKTQYALDTQLIPYVGGRMLVFGAAGYAKINLSENNSTRKGAYEKFFTTYNDSTPVDLINKLKSVEFVALEKLFLDNAEQNAYMKPYIDIYTKEKSNFEKVYNIIKSSSYGTGNLKTDLNDLKVAMNNNLG